MQPRCANPECPANYGYAGSIEGHWVQIEKIRMAGELRGQGPVQHLFAAVACSKRCAVAVLTAALPEEDAARQQDESLLGNLRRAGQNG